MTKEYCCECDEPTERAGRYEDSIYIEFPDKEIGPLCDECRSKYLVCDNCGLGVYPQDVTFDKKHKHCGGECY